VNVFEMLVRAGVLAIWRNFLFGGDRHRSRRSAIEAILPEIANEFMTCIEKYDLKACYDRSRRRNSSVANLHSSTDREQIKTKLAIESQAVSERQLHLRF